MTTETMTSILAAVPMPLIHIGANEHILDINPSAASVFGKDMEGRHFLTVLRQPDVAQCISTTLADGVPAQTRMTMSGHNEDTVYLVRCVPVDQEKAWSSLVSFEDMTSLESVGRMRRDFVANVSHELRTPLTALLGFIETLRGPARHDADARDKFLETMETEAGRMNRLIDDLLSLTRVEGEERMRPTKRVDLLATITSVSRSLGPLAEEAGVSLELGSVESGDVYALGDPDQLAQVFTNLIENAIKYAADGKRVVFSIRKTARDPVLRAAALQVDVEDFGQGVDSIHIHRLTERFYRADSHRSRNLGGTGLGLAIVKHIVNRHRGRLRITSELGKGSCFSVILPRPTSIASGADQQSERLSY